MTHTWFIGSAIGVTLVILGGMAIASLWQRQQAVQQVQQWMEEEDESRS